jgi:hypothetical protein
MEEEEEEGSMGGQHEVLDDSDDGELPSEEEEEEEVEEGGNMGRQPTPRAGISRGRAQQQQPVGAVGSVIDVRVIAKPIDLSMKKADLYVKWIGIQIGSLSINAATDELSLYYNQVLDMLSGPPSDGPLRTFLSQLKIPPRGPLAVWDVKAKELCNQTEDSFGRVLGDIISDAASKKKKGLVLEVVVCLEKKGEKPSEAWYPWKPLAYT